MDSKLRKALDQIDEVLAKRDTTATQLWGVLTALRGPDTAGHQVKTDSTVKIRRAAFPKTTLEGEDGYDDGGSFPLADFGRRDADNSVVYLSPDRSNQWHFNNHIEMAAIPLRLRIGYEGADDSH